MPLTGVCEKTSHLLINIHIMLIALMQYDFCNIELCNLYKELTANKRTSPLPMSRLVQIMHSSCCMPLIWTSATTSASYNRSCRWSRNVYLKMCFNLFGGVIKLYVLNSKELKIFMTLNNWSSRC